MRGEMERHREERESDNNTRRFQMEQLRAKEAEVKAQVVGARVRVLFGESALSINLNS